MTRVLCGLVFFAPILVALAGTPPGAWKTSPPLKATHFWDCNGAGRDAGTLQPWNPDKYRYSPMYAPLNPAEFGGDSYGEKMWMTGAANDDLARLMGASDGCCGSDKAGGCGKCLLIKNPEAKNADWTVVVMKKNQCPPESNGCGPGSAHFDLAVPGFDNLQFSTANICGKPGTYLGREQSDVCGSWYNSASDTSSSGCCDRLPESTTEQKRMKQGCKLFAAWGWKKGDPSNLQYQAVPCPAKFKLLMQGSFNGNGVGATVAPGGGGPTTVDPKPPTPGAVTPGGGGCSGTCPATTCGCDWATAGACATNDGSQCNKECCCKHRCPASSPTKPPTRVASPCTCPATTCGCGWATASTCASNDGSQCNKDCCCKFRCPKRAGAEGEEEDGIGIEASAAVPASAIVHFAVTAGLLLGAVKLLL